MSEQVVAPLAGKIISIDTVKGAKIEEDEEVVVIEAMKMETPIFAPCDGTIAEIRVKEGDEVEEDDVIAIIEQD
ncbi:acetyl-CoA carboxylase biotin carboxyl carrier protein subunit [Desulfobacterales bacterium HSG16]|nr:acetyl-CoA carboxylase biotin carboxyl carrier protein subunit [Desulfobacterales bacterium HSG16]